MFRTAPEIEAKECLDKVHRCLNRVTYKDGQWCWKDQYLSRKIEDSCGHADEKLTFTYGDLHPVPLLRSLFDKTLNVLKDFCPEVPPEELAAPEPSDLEMVLETFPRGYDVAAVKEFSDSWLKAPGFIKEETRKQVFGDIQSRYLEIHKAVIGVSMMFDN